VEQSVAGLAEQQALLDEAVAAQVIAAASLGDVRGDLGKLMARVDHLDKERADAPKAAGGALGAGTEERLVALEQANKVTHFKLGHTPTLRLSSRLHSRCSPLPLFNSLRSFSLKNTARSVPTVL